MSSIVNLTSAHISKLEEAPYQIEQGDKHGHHFYN